MRAHVPLGVHLSSALYKLLLRPGDVEQLTLADLQQLDPQVAATCKRLLAEPGAEGEGEGCVRVGVRGAGARG